LIPKVLEVVDQSLRNTPVRIADPGVNSFHPTPPYQGMAPEALVRTKPGTQRQVVHTIQAEKLLIGCERLLATDTGSRIDGIQ
jgi:hypothetical protein